MQRFAVTGVSLRPCRAALALPTTLPRRALLVNAPRRFSDQNAIRPTKRNLANVVAQQPEPASRRSFKRRTVDAQSYARFPMAAGQSILFSEELTCG